ncbi:Cytochrome c-type protein NrfH [Posidoniimonas corsicana]|uniref:Cytochrome c-type protein NrfH n=1 Tax=Posidoniimonas corsicana TaxID=1938618 RepID=A0A5C5UV41_9BACT|nr:cytochrome c nitrite reductase small subunit [Posidoniimonas corsicana]TWT29235.1 Cytochrome c-type protein NrfH [Posidoniimonas corsicana]
MSARNAFLSLTALALLCAALIGAAVGLGAFTFVYAEGASYLTNDPNACANCHVMQGHLDAWVKSSHSKFATCNDCHAPHNFVGKYYCKARNGFFHSLAFTTGEFPQNIRMHEYNRGVTEHACLDCHADVTHSIQVSATGSGGFEAVSCIRCHSTVGHDT